MAAFGEEVRSGAEAAVEAINARGGVLGEKLVLDFYDDACNPAQAVSTANKIAARRPIAVFGNFCSAATLAAADVYTEANLPQITLSSNPKITQGNHKNLFRILGRDDQEAADLASYVIQSTLQTRRIAILDDKGTWGVGLADHALKTFQQAGATVAWRDSVTSGQKDFSALVTRLKNDSITDVVLGVYLMESALLVRQAREQGYKGNFYGGDAIQSPEFWKIQSGVYDPRHTLAGQKLAETLKKRNKPLSAYSFHGYAALEVLSHAIKQAKSKKSSDIIAALHKGSFDTMLGKLTYDAQGDLRDYHFQIFKWHDGDYAPVSVAK
ncbi:MAG: branched-chain amino acid ABC transporter substrate-binding protein [Proteobacteria bacterium]|nr:branched-chain amino acid ABC transporter substrate-binding protein [Pseudomonadota bacterium]